MNRSVLLELGVRYTVLYAGSTVLIVFFGSQLFNYAFGFAALLLLLGSLVATPLIFGTSDVGLETVESGGEAGFQGITNPSQYQPDTVHFPSRLQFGLYLVGIAVHSVLGLFLAT